MNVLLLLLVILIGLFVWYHIKKRTIEKFTVTQYIFPIYIFNTRTNTAAIPASQPLSMWRPVFPVLNGYTNATQAQITQYNGTKNPVLLESLLYYIVGPNTFEDTYNGTLGTDSLRMIKGGTFVEIQTSVGSSSSSSRVTIPENRGSSSSSSRVTIPGNRGSSSSSSRVTIPENRGSSSSLASSIPFLVNNEFNTQITPPTLPDSPCNKPSLQQSYQINQCTLYTNFIEAYNATNDVVEKQNLLNAYTTSKLKMNGAQYTQTYFDIVNNFFQFDKFIVNLFKSKNTIPYTIDAPKSISLLDYVPGVINWETASSNPKSYKCIPYNNDELSLLTDIKKYVQMNALPEDYLVNIKKNMCISKGYKYNNGSYANEGCTNCNGCCMPSDEELSNVTENGGSDVSNVTCPKPKVRPFKLSGRKLKLRIVSPKLKEATECFTNQFGRDIQQILRSAKLKEFQQFPIY